jgi:hypothetical protein
VRARAVELAFGKRGTRFGVSVWHVGVLGSNCEGDEDGGAGAEEEGDAAAAAPHAAVGAVARGATTGWAPPPPAAPPEDRIARTPPPPPPQPSGAGAAADDDAAWCRAQRDANRVQPGRSWGGLPKTGQAIWMRRRCDRFFCQPNPREGRGTYDCQPPR